MGSTSVPDLYAKPVIDISLTVGNSADESAYIPDLEAEGLNLVIREPDWQEQRCLAKSPAGATCMYSHPTPSNLAGSAYSPTGCAPIPMTATQSGHGDPNFLWLPYPGTPPDRSPDGNNAPDDRTG